jgi:hypothetical protein
MIKKLESCKLDEPDSTIAIKNDRNEIAKAMYSLFIIENKFSF